MGDAQEIKLNSQDVFLKLIEGQARIETKLDSNNQAISLNAREIRSLKTEIDMIKGERRYLRYVQPFIVLALSTALSVLIKMTGK